MFVASAIFVVGFALGAISSYYVVRFVNEHYK